MQKSPIYRAIVFSRPLRASSYWKHLRVAGQEMKFAEEFVVSESDHRLDCRYCSFSKAKENSCNSSCGLWKTLGIKRKSKRKDPTTMKKWLLKKLREEKELGSAENIKADHIKWIYVKVRKQKTPIYRAIVSSRPLQASSYSEAPKSLRPGDEK
ncbi:hypothetical protein CEXT_751061 [Caerostris extrusa]|uniref:Uncharacterized protein n=1 Tax=Caerostris extrusa TaxID=172846 RepID=A0AAV4U0U8_CAEEX|nr:hypothetical protein CEXT_751061 [Caerostris extrusa]